MKEAQEVVDVDGEESTMRRCALRFFESQRVWRLAWRLPRKREFVPKAKRYLQNHGTIANISSVIEEIVNT